MSPNRFFCFLKSFLDTKVYDSSHQLLDHSLTSHSLPQLGHTAILVPTRLNRFNLTSVHTRLCHILILVHLGRDLIPVLVHSGTRPCIPTKGPYLNRSFPDLHPLLDLIIFRFWSSPGLNRLTPTIGPSPTWLCCDPGPFLDGVDFSSAISAGAMRYGILDIGAVPGSGSAMNGSALPKGCPVAPETRPRTH